MKSLDVVLISTYDLGRQPFGLSSPAAWIASRGHRVTCLDLAIERLDEAAIAAADLVAFHVPMHTATRIAARLVGRVRAMNPAAHLCFYGLYAPLNRDYLRGLGVDTILGGEFETGLVALVEGLAKDGPSSTTAVAAPISLIRQQFHVPDRSGLPPLDNYAFVQNGANGRRTVGYTEATRGCKHFCRHCPIVPVYQGQFRVVQRDIVLADIRAQVAAGAEHITFGDPDFFNGPTHALRIVESLHAEFPHVTFDATVKIEHLLQHARHLPALKRNGCLFITSAVEALEPHILDIFQKGHTVQDFRAALALCRQHGLVLNPTFVTFTPWTTLAGYRELLALIVELDLVENIAPIQYAIRLLIPAGSHLLALPEVRDLVGDFDEAQLCYPWVHPDPAVDRLQTAVMKVVEESQGRGASRSKTFAAIWRLANAAAPESTVEDAWIAAMHQRPKEKCIPHLSEPWYC